MSKSYCLTALEGLTQEVIEVQLDESGERSVRLRILADREN
jgi:hypothetical protein